MVEQLGKNIELFREAVPGLSSHAATEDTLEASVLVTFEGNRDETDFEIAKVEIVKAPHTIDFGFVQAFSEPEYEPDYEPPDEDDQLPDQNDSSDAQERPQPSV